MVIYLIDTDVLIEFFKGRKDVVTLVQKLGGSSSIAISVITLAEILEGIIDIPEKLEQIKDVLLQLQVIPVTDEIAEIFAQERSLLRKKGNLIDNMDLFIAATAISHNLTLITNNTKDFRRIYKLKLLTMDS